MIRYGTGRAVLPLGPLAFKFSRNDQGALCNRHEAELYARIRHKPHRKAILCPVFWCSPAGKLQIARRTQTPITQEQLANLMCDNWADTQWQYMGVGDDGQPFEWKVDDWGVLNGKVVAVDYAATVTLPVDAPGRTRPAMQHRPHRHR